jgi:hypothetical protein
MFPWDCSWAEMDPSRHPFDRDAVAEVIRGLPPAAEVPLPQPGYDDPAYPGWWSAMGHPWVEAMTAAIVDYYGSWAVGWHWSTGEGDLDGGVVAAWCCPHHSIKAPDATLTAVTQALLEWRDWLERLAEWFDRFLPVPPGADEEALLELWERAVAHLITMVVDWTDCDSGWHKSARTVLKWFLQAAAVPPDRHDELIEHAMGGRFRSWATPTNLTITQAAEIMAADLVRPADA